MGTRCQVRVEMYGMEFYGKREGMTDKEIEDWLKDPITLYHHFDGYPHYMLPLIRQAYMLVVKKEKDWAKRSGKPYDPDEASMMWEAGRSGKAASYLCAADPGGFEPEVGHELHGDIEWFYVLRVVNKKGGSMGDIPDWFVDVYVPPSLTDTKDFWDHPTFEKLKLVQPNIKINDQPVQTLTKVGDLIEKKLEAEWKAAHPDEE